MDYINSNKRAWEEAFEHRRPNWGGENDIRLKNENLPFIGADVASELKKIDFAGKTIAQFCCNNGRELMSIMQLGAEYGVGFDIAENIIEQAKDTARKSEIHCDFVACDILKIGDEFHNRFDFIIFTIGAITWFEDLALLFGKVSKCLKPNGLLFINDFHPFMNMLPLPDDDCFDETALNKLAYSYFRKEPWIENNGMGYMTPEYESETFTSFSHTLSDIINAAAETGMRIRKLNEYSYDVGLTDVYDRKGYPLSFTLIAQKPKE